MIYYIMDDWRLYEDQVVNYHRKTYNQTVWHTNVIPEEELVNCGYINDYNLHRLKRIAKRREAQGKEFKYNDYGFDGLAKDSDNNYTFIQAKHRIMVRAKDIGTFLIVIAGTRRTGHLYISGKIEINCRDQIMNSEIVKYRVLPFTKQNEVVENTNENEYELRDYQRNAIEAILEYSSDSESDSESVTESDSESMTESDSVTESDTDSVTDSDIDSNSESLTDDSDSKMDTCTNSSESSSYKTANRKAIQLFTGGGKTVIAGNVLKRSNYKLIICIAPLLISVENLRERLPQFIPNYEVLVVDSETGGTTDPTYIKSRLEENKPLIIFSTFKSTEEILIKLIKPSKEMFLLVDEAHNLLGRNTLIEFSNKFHNLLAVSATIPEELYETLHVENVYQYSIGDAIKNRYAPDYNVYLPYINRETNEVILDIPEEFKSLDKDLVSQALFLATGIIQQGKKHCICYMSTTEQCDKFKNVLIEVFDKHHAISIWIEKIDHNVSKKRREEILKEFQNDSYETIKFILSVRVLDEAVDIVKCDSQYISAISEDFSRSVQRLGRGLRLDKNNPTKKNSLFIWTNDWNKVVNALTLLKQDDPEFHKKVKLLNSDYNKGNDTEKKEKIIVESKELNKFIVTKCLSIDDIWEIRRENWSNFYNDKGRYPSDHSKDKDEKRAGQWQSDMRKYYKKGKLSKERVNKLNSTQGWNWEKDSFDENLNTWSNFYNDKGRYPSNHSKDRDEKKLAGWQSYMRQNYKNKKLSKERVDKLNSTEGWNWEKDSFDENLNTWSNFYNDKGRYPSNHSKDRDEKKLAGWKNTMRQNYKNKKLSKERVDKLNSTEGWKWEEGDPFDENLNTWSNFYNDKGRYPSENSKDKDEKRAGIWQKHMRKNYKKGKLSQERIDKLNNTQGWKWEEQDPFDENLNSWSNFYNNKGRSPSSESKDKDEKRAGIWQKHMRKNYKNKKLSKERVDKLNSTQGWKWEEGDPFDENLNTWSNFYNNKGRSPSRESKDKDEKRAGLWQCNMRQNYKKGKLSKERIDKLNSTQGWNWGKNCEPFDESLNSWSKFYKNKGRSPSSESKDKDEKKLGGWQSRMRNNYKNKKLSKERIDKLNNTQGWKWEAI